MVVLPSDQSVGTTQSAGTPSGRPGSAVTVPTIEGDPERQAGNYTSDHLAPLANVRILGFDKDGKTRVFASH